MEFRQAVLEETEEILKKCNSRLYLKILKLTEYIQDNFDTNATPKKKEHDKQVIRGNINWTDIDERLTDKGAGGKIQGEKDEKQRQERKDSSENEQKTDTGSETDTSKGTNTDTSSSYTSTQKEKKKEKEKEREKTKGRGRGKMKLKGDKMKAGNQSIKNFFQVVEKKKTKDNDDEENANSDTFNIGGVNTSIKKYVPLVNVFFFYGYFNIIIIIYFLLYKTDMFTGYLYVNDDSDSNEEYIIYNNKRLIHIMCTRLNECNLSAVNKIIDDLLINRISSFKIFILENFDCLRREYKKTFMNNLNKTKNLVFIHSTSCDSDIFLSNCLYMRIPKPTENVFYSYVLQMMQTKYNIEIYEEKKNSLMYLLKQCNFDFTLILTIIYFIQVNNVNDFSKLLKLVVNPNLKKLISVIHKCSVTNSSMFLIRNILYNIIDSYFDQMQTFLNKFCKELISYHRSDDDEYKKEIYFLFSEYSVYAALTDNPIVVLENLCSKLIIIEQKFAHSLKGKEEIESASFDEMSTFSHNPDDETPR